MHVLGIQAQDTYPLRQVITSIKRGPNNFCFAGDMDEKTLHLGAFVDKKLVSIASFYFRQNPDIDAPYQYQLQGLVTHPEYTKQGIARALLLAAIPTILQNQGHVIWGHSPVDTVGFFLTVGFQPIGGPVEIKEGDEIQRLQLLYKKLV